MLARETNGSDAEFDASVQTPHGSFLFTSEKSSFALAVAVVILFGIGFGFQARAQVTVARPALIERMTSAYKAGAFDRFFGAVAWARANEWPSFSADQRDRLQALEVLALARNCRWNEIKALRAEAGANTPQLEAAFAHARMKAGYPEMPGDSAPVRRTAVQTLAHRQSRWGAPASALTRLRDPEHVRVELKSLCAHP